MQRLLILSFIIVISITTATATAADLPHGVRPRDRAAYTADATTFQCLDGSARIARTMVNDDYCDCADGSDEPGTSACSNGRYWCRNKGHKGKYVPSSAVNDGICDCCDGSDEYLNGDRVQCANTCEADGAGARREREELLKVIEAGVEIKQKWVEEGQIFLTSQQTKLAELQEQLKAEEAKVAAAQALKEQEEAAEKAEDERRRAEFEAAHANDPPAADTTATATTGEDAVPPTPPPPPPPPPATTGGDEEQKEENFPYPKEYAAPAATTTETEENFPYPKEYAAPPAGEQKVDEQIHQDEDDADTLTEGIEPPATAAADEAPKYVEYKSETANEARRVHTEATKAKDEVQRKVDELNKVVALDFGPDNVLASLYDACYEFKQNQYTYEMCPFKNAAQKEHGSTSLGNWDKYDRDKETFTFTQGATCWQGPARSLTVRLRCGLKNEVISVTEPSKCVYEMVFLTPAVCHHAHADALRMNLSSEGDDDDDDE